MDSLETALAAPADTTSPALSCCSAPTLPPNVMRSWMRDWRVLAGVGLVVGGSGLALSWGWLTAIGIAPLLVSTAPCLLMCALGLCMKGHGHQTNAVAAGAAVGEPVNAPDREASS